MQRIIILAMPMLMSVGMVNAQKAYVSVQQNGTSLASTLRTASYDVSSQEATLSFDDNGNAVMTYNSQTVAKLTSEEVDNGGELVGDLEGTETKVSKAISQDFATLYSPFQLQVPNGATVTVYAPTLEGNTLKMNDSRKLTGIIPPCTGLILYGTAGSNIVFNYSADIPVTVEDNALSGTSVVIDNPTKSGAVDGKLVYTLAHVDGTAGLYRYTGDKLGAGKAYLYTTQVSSAKPVVFSFEEDIPTGITSHESQNEHFNGKVIENNQLIILKNGRKYNVNGQALN